MSVTDVLLDILIVLVAAKVAAEIAERINVPAVVAEIVAGVIIGPSVLSLVGGDETLKVLGELGVILLLLGVGMEMDLSELGAVGRASLSVAIVGVAVPMAGGYTVASVLGHSSNQSLFIGAALSATSVGITARVFSDLRALATVEARTVLGAAVADDVLGLVILTVVVRLVAEGSVSIADVAVIVAVAIGFLVITAVLGSRFAPSLFQFLDRHAKSAGTLVALALAFTLAFAELADAAKLAPIVGAFVAGLALSRSSSKERIQRELAPVGHLFIPVFFLGIGIDAQVETFVKPEVLGIAAGLMVVAVIGKLVAAVGVFGSPGDKWLIGLGMIPRGEVGLIFATIGLNEGILGKNLYAALLLVVLLTTLMTPPLLRWRLGQVRAGRRRQPEAVSSRPPGGWVQAHQGIVDLAAQPPSTLALEIVLDAARLMTDGARPGERLLEWIGELSETPLRWSPASTKQLFTVLTEGDVRALRFLDTTGVLERALPELAAAVDRRRNDPFLLDPAQILHFVLVEQIRVLVETDPKAASQHAKLQHPEWLLLAALILDSVGEDATPVVLARRIAHRLDLGATAEQQIAMVVEDADLFGAAAGRFDGLEEERVTPIAIHLDNPERARALYLLTLARGDLTAWEHARLDELLALVLQLLAQPEITGLDARNLLERRRSEAIRLAGDRDAVVERIRRPRPVPTYSASRPPMWLDRLRLSTRSPRAAKQASRFSRSNPTSGASKLPLGTDQVSCRRCRARLPHSGSTSSTQSSRRGTTAQRLAAFVVRHDESISPGNGDETASPDPVALEAAIVAAFSAPLQPTPNREAELRFDDHASPWYTICEVESPDRRGLLQDLTAAMVSAGANVHSARLVSIDGVAVDRFELTDLNGHKLDEAMEQAAIQAVRNGVTPKRKALGRSVSRPRSR